MIVEILVAGLIVLGAAFALIGSIGLARFPDVFTRLHGPTKATTLGVGSLIVASAISVSTRGDGAAYGEVLVAAFLFLTAPVSAHLLSKAALHRRNASQCELPPREH